MSIIQYYFEEKCFNEIKCNLSYTSYRTNRIICDVVEIYSSRIKGLNDVMSTSVLLFEEGYLYRTSTTLPFLQ